MGFSSALQGRAAHDALIVRQDAELRLMETMKRCIQIKAKCDREYAISLGAVSQQGLKIDRADELQGSQITKSWRTFMDELDQQAKQFRVNAELLEVVCEKITHLSQDKRRARKSYQEEHSKIAARLNHLTEEVARKKSEYQKHLEGYKALRTRFEEHYIKSGRGGRKLDDVRDKYQKACRKLHLTHNEYVLSITEAIEVEKDFRTVLLPGLLEHQESVQESFILLWKKILQEVCQYSDLTSDKFHDIQKRIESVINNINPNEEYREFTEKHKTSPATPVTFQFDESLIEDIPGKLQASTLTVDNLTVDWLRSRLNDLEISVKETQEKQEKLINESNGSPYLNGINGCSTGKENQKKSKDLNSLKCQEKQKQKLADMIKSHLSEVGCEELPSGCDDHLAVEQNFIENTIINDQQIIASSNISTHSVSTIFQRGADVMSIIRVPFFKRRSTPRSPPIKPRNRTTKKLDEQPRSHSMGSLSVNSLDVLDKNRSIHRNDINNKPKKGSTVSLLLESDTINSIPNIVIDDLCVNINTNNSVVLPVIVATATDIQLTTNNNTNNNNNNNNIYAELELSDQLSNEILTETNHENPNEENCNILPVSEENNDNIENSSVGVTSTTSIDAHLDKIDEINRILDDNFIRRTLPRPPIIPKNETYVTLIDSNLNDDDDVQTVQTNINNVASEMVTEKDEIELTNEEESMNQISPILGGFESKDISPVNLNVKKRSISFSHKLMTNFSNFKFSINSKQPIQKSTTDQHQHHHQDDKVDGTELNISKNEPSSSSIESNLIDNFKINKPKQKAIDKKSLDKLKKTTNSNKKPIRNTFRSKLFNFQMRRDKVCDHCAKRRRKIHPSKSVFDFAKEFNVNELTAANDNDLCACSHHLPSDLCNNSQTATSTSSTNNINIENNCCEISTTSSNEDFLCIKEHTYCVPFINDISYTSNRPLYEEEWFHGVLPREEVVRLLKIDGDFLVRETIRNEESQIVLSVCCRNGHKHFIVQTTIEGHYRFEGPKFPSIQELIIHQYQSELPVTVKSGVILRKPVLRERWELSNDDVMLLEKIGRGNFGDVYKAKLKSTKLDVAVKTCRMTLPDEQKRKFLQEGRILKQYDHPNIVKLIGICVQKQPIMIVMELVPGGSLLNFLRKNANTLTARQLMGMCRDAAAGMRYLESKNCIHRDLAARNCLIDSENSVKISDFGMSREEEEYIVSDGMKQIPVKWTAPEALHFGKYTTLCDVWSYGILMWEIFSKGDTPYSGLSNSRAREKIDTGFRMPAPENTPAEIYRLMLKCWAAEAESRPHFDEIYTVVDSLINRHDNL